MNLARAMESSGPGAGGLSSSPRENGELKDQAAERTRRGGQDLQRGCGILAVGQFRRASDLADEDGQGLSLDPVGLIGAPPCRRSGTAGDRAVSARQAIQRPRNGNRTSFFSIFVHAALPAHDAVGARPGARTAEGIDPHTRKKGRILRSADHQRAGAVRIFVLTNPEVLPPRRWRRAGDKPRFAA